MTLDVTLSDAWYEARGILKRALEEIQNTVEQAWTQDPDVRDETAALAVAMLQEALAKSMAILRRATAQAKEVRHERGA